MNAIDAHELIAQLEESWLVLNPSGRWLARISPVHSEGVVAPLYTAQETAELAAEQASAGDFEARRAPPLWQAAQLAAAQGFAGMLVDEQIPLFFVTTEGHRPSPTHLALPDYDGLLYVGETGPAELKVEQVEPWIDHAAFDQQSIRWVLGMDIPFVGYEPDMPLFDYLPDGLPQPTVDKGSLLEQDSHTRGAIALFSTPFAAEWYWENRPGTRLSGEGEQAEQIARHETVRQYLDRFAAALPEGVSVILNPGRHRFYQGFFRQLEDNWFLVTINGVWRVDSPFRCTPIARRS